MAQSSTSQVRESRDAIKNPWGPRTPYQHKWPTRVDVNCVEEPEKWVQSACVLCSNGCGMDIGVKNGKIVGVRGRAVDRVNKGRLGPKGLYGWTATQHTDRLTHPLIRRDGELKRASWDEAMALITDKAKNVIKRLTAHGIGFYTSGQLFLEEYYTLAVIGKAGLRTLHMDGNTRLCTATAAASMRESFGSDGQAGSYGDIDYTECMLIVGHNMAATQTVLWSRVLDRLVGPNPPKLIVIDSRESETAKKATIHLKPKIGTNLALLNGIQYLLFEDDRVNEQYVSKHVCGIEALRETVNSYPPNVVEEITGVPQADLRKAADMLGSSDSLLSTVLQGVYQSNQATASACQVNNINLLLGRIGKPGSGVLQMNGQPTAQNNREAGCDGEYPAFRNFSNESHMQELADLWNIDFHQLPHWNQPTHIENMLKYIEAGSMQMFWVSGTNPLVSLPNLPRARKLLARPDLFLVVQDIFMTETAAVADVVLPAAQWSEKTGCFTNVDRTVHISQKAVDPPGQCKSDMEIFIEFAKRMDIRDKDGQQLVYWSTPEEAFNAWKKISKGRPCDYSGLTYEKLSGGSGIQWPCNEEYPYGKERLYDDGRFFTNTDYCESFGHDLETGAPMSKEEYTVINPAGRAILKTCHYRASQELPDDEFPLLLSTGRNKFHFHTRTKTGRSKRLNEACSEPWIEVSQADADRAAVKNDDDVIVRSRRGAVQVKATVTSILPGQVFMPFHFGYFDNREGKASAANELTIDQWDVVSKQPMFKSGTVRLEPLPQSEVRIHSPGPYVRAPQSSIEQAVRQQKPDAADPSESTSRETHLKMWIGATYEPLRALLEIYDSLISSSVQDYEVLAGLKIMRRITEDILKRLEPATQKYGSNAEYGQNSAKRLRGLFPEERQYIPSFEVMQTLLGLQVYYADIEAHLSALVPVSNALWDKGFIQNVQAALKDIGRMKSWVSHNIKVRAPQTLIVPARMD